MPPKLRNKNQRTTTPSDGLDKKDPLDLETLNSEPKGKGKSMKLRLQARQEREKLLQKHRVMQQEGLKRQHERELMHQKALAEQQHQPEQQHPQREQYPGTETREHPVVHDQVPPDHNDEDHGALGDWNTRNAKSNHQRCTNCCGRPQFSGRPEPQQCHKCSVKFDSVEGIVYGSQFNCTECIRSTDEISNEIRGDECSLECINDEREKSLSTTTINGTSENCDLQLKGKCDQEDTGISAVYNPETISESVSFCPVENEDEKRKSDGCRFHGHNDQVYENKEAPQASSFHEKPNIGNENETRLRGGCGGGCGGGGGGRNSAVCPCGGCGGAACAINTVCGNKPSLGCCGGNQSRALPCRCRCSSSSNPSPPCGTCGGQNCGKWNSCAGSGGGKCCFPRNTRRHSGPNCCGGSGGCGGCS